MMRLRIVNDPDLSQALYAQLNGKLAEYRVEVPASLFL